MSSTLPSPEDVDCGGECRSVSANMERNRERMTVRGLSENYNKVLKSLFKSSAISASARSLGTLRSKQKTNYRDPRARVELEDLRFG